MTVKNKGNMLNRKRKLSDSALQQPKGKKPSFLTPQHQGAKNGVTPKQLKQTPKQQKTTVKTPNPQNSGKAKPMKPTPKGSAQTPKGKAKLQQKDSDDDDDDDDDEEEEGEEKMQMAGGLFKGQLEEDDDDDDDDDEEEDDDDDEEEEDDEDDSEDGEEDQDNEAGDSNEDDDEEEEEDESEDDEEDLQPASKRARLEPQATPDKKKETPNKNTQKLDSGDITSPKAGTPKQVAAVDNSRKDDRDARTLFVKNLPGDCTVKMIKALSKDIKQVRLRINVTNRKKPRMGYAFVEFANEASAEKNFKVLEGAMIKGNKLVVDYVGSKSTFKNPKKETKPEDIDPLRLYVAGLPPDVTEADLRQVFPKATEIHIPMSHKEKRPLGFGFVNFSSPELAKQYHNKCQETTLKGLTLVVLYAKKRTEPVAKKDNQAKKQKQKVSEPPAKKAKVEKAAEEEEEDEDDDDDDEDDDDDDDDEDDDDEAADGDEGDSDDDDEDEDDDDGEDDDDDDDDEDDDDDDDDED